MVLPLVLLLLLGMFLICLSLLSLTMISRRSSHLRLDRLQAELALRAGLSDFQTRLLEGCQNEDYLVIQDTPGTPKQPAHLYLVAPSFEQDRLRYGYRPLFSCESEFPSMSQLKVPERVVADENRARLRPHPWLDAVSVDWLALRDEDGRMVARYAYWVEDLEGKIDPSKNLVRDQGPIRLQAMDDSANHQRARHLLQRRKWMVSPQSILAAAGAELPLQRWSRHQNPEFAGRLKNPWEAFLEANTTVGLRGYEEQARVPFVRGLSPQVMGRPKCNLNQLLSLPGELAVRQMASWIQTGLPEFKQRAGGFPENYLESLAANAIDYADRDGQPLVRQSRYRGIDGQPFLSEVVLHLHYQGMVREGDRWVMKWTLRLFAELWNLGSQPVEAGLARLSYEVNLQPTPVGVGEPGKPFDSPDLLEDGQQSQHQLERHGERYLTPAIEVKLRPDEFRFYEFAKVDYAIACTPQLDDSGQPLAEWFDLVEEQNEARGLALWWNGSEVERLERIHRDPYGLADFRTDARRKTAKACVPALNYGGYASIINNPGDPRMSHYLRGLPVGENAYPENLSPHRRNIRRRNIYDLDPSPMKSRHYGRVMPSEWADGGHDSATGNFRVTTSDARMPTDEELWPLSEVPTPLASHAPQRLSNHGLFLQVTELGRIHDPLMWTPAYPDLIGLSGSGKRDTAELIGLLSIWQRPALPARRGQWPEVSWGSVPSAVHGGGNSLRIGRAEHARFDQPGLRASHLLDLFHCGQAEARSSYKREGPTIRAEGRINLNTASPEVLQCLTYGALREDEAIARVISPVHETHEGLRPQLEPWQATELELRQTARRIAEGIIQSRPFASVSELSQLRDVEGEALFGNPRLLAPDEILQWSDAAAEECFARVHGAGGVRSRNFRVWQVGQCVQEHAGQIEVKAEVRRVVNVFVDPGERNGEGELIPANQKVRVLNERAF